MNVISFIYRQRLLIAALSIGLIVGYAVATYRSQSAAATSERVIERALATLAVQASCLTARYLHADCHASGEAQAIFEKIRTCEEDVTRILQRTCGGPLAEEYRSLHVHYYQTLRLSVEAYRVGNHHAYAEQTEQLYGIAQQIAQLMVQHHRSMQSSELVQRMRTRVTLTKQLIEVPAHQWCELMKFATQLIEVSLVQAHDLATFCCCKRIAPY